MRVLVIGAGAMGSIFGAAFARAGCSVVFHDTRADVVATIRDRGLRLSGVLGDSVVRHEAVDDPGRVGSADMVLVEVDSGSTAAAARIAAAALDGGGLALTLQNGIGNWEALADVLGEERVLAGSTYNSGAALGAGDVLHSNLGHTELGEIDGSVSNRAQLIADLLTRGGLPTSVSQNIVAVVWSKFVHNCAINPVSAITGLRAGEIARDPAAARLLDLVLDEVLAVVAAAEVTLPEPDPRGHIHDHCWERYNRPSMLQHVEAGRGTEIDALNGALVARGRALGVPVPVNEAIALAIKGREAANAARAAGGIDEAALEAAARSDPRAGRWGTSEPGFPAK
jgi:2-dehydropantoate 2-reductase